MSLKRGTIVEQKEIKVLYTFYQYFLSANDFFFFFPDMKVIDSERQR